MKEYWDAEVKLRMRTEQLTARETQDLLAIVTDEGGPGHSKFVLVDFGHPCMTEVLDRWAFSLVGQQNPPLQPGDMVDPKSEMFSLFKGVMRGHHRLQDPLRIAGCNCLCKTWFMPMGCSCKHLQGQVGVTKHYLCRKCSTCLRCGKLFGSISAMLTVHGMTWHIHTIPLEMDAVPKLCWNVLVFKLVPLAVFIRFCRGLDYGPDFLCNCIGLSMHGNF